MIRPTDQERIPLEREFIIHTDLNRESIYNAMVGTTQVITGVGHNVGGVEMTCGQEPSLWFS